MKIIFKFGPQTERFGHPWYGVTVKVSSGVDPTKLFFFTNEEFFRFSLVSFHFLLDTEKNMDSKMT
jgi:hypothetical protein